MLKAWIAATLLLLVTGCSPHYSVRDPGYPWDKTEKPFAGRVVDACEDLVDDAEDLDRRNDTLLVASFAKLGALNESSPLGRLLAQQCANAIVEEGYQVSEALLADSLLIDPDQGEFLLSRDLNAVAQRNDAERVVVGTYTVGQERVYVTVKVVRASDARVLSAKSFELAIGDEVRALL